MHRDLSRRFELMAAALLAAATQQPEQVHLAYAGENGAGMSVSWHTALPSNTIVHFGAGSLSSNRTGSSQSYIKDGGWHHRVVIDALPGDTEYTYRVDGDSVERTFRTASAAVDATVTLAIFGDMGFENSTVRPMQLHDVSGLKRHWSATFTRDAVLRLVQRDLVDAVWHVGDVGYADDGYTHGIGKTRYEESYNGFMNWIEPIAASVPYHVSPGNHESECHSPACVLHQTSLGKPLSNFSAFNARWSMPYAESGGTSNMWYSFNAGPVHFVSLDTETDWPGAGEEHTGDSHIPWLRAGTFGRKGEYLAWLERDLAAADAARQRRPWIVAGGHRPFEELEATHGALFRKYGVDAYFAGHVHSYHREQYTKGNGSMLSVVVGGAGCEEMEQAPRSEARGHGHASFSSKRYASGVLKANRTELSWRLIDSEDGIELDAVSLTR